MGISVIVSTKLKNKKNNENIAELPERIFLLFLAHIIKFCNRFDWLV